MPFKPFGYDDHHVARERRVGVLRGSFTDPGLPGESARSVLPYDAGGKRVIIRVIDGKI